MNEWVMYAAIAALALMFFGMFRKTIIKWAPIGVGLLAIGALYMSSGGSLPTGSIANIPGLEVKSTAVDLIDWTYSLGAAGPCPTFREQTYGTVKKSLYASCNVTAPEYSATIPQLSYNVTLRRRSNGFPVSLTGHLISGNFRNASNGNSQSLYNLLTSTTAGTFNSEIDDITVGSLTGMNPKKASIVFAQGDAVTTFAVELFLSQESLAALSVDDQRELAVVVTDSDGNVAGILPLAIRRNQ
jgi:hypothetical protein